MKNIDFLKFLFLLILFQFCYVINLVSSENSQMDFIGRKSMDFELKNDNLNNREIPFEIAKEKIDDGENDSTTDRDDVFSSTSKLKDLIESELEIIKLLETFVDFTTEQLKTINEYATAQRKFLFSGKEKLDVSHPINAYLLIRKTSSDYEFAGRALYGIANYSKSVEDWINGYRVFKNFPLIEDVNGAANALTRIQETYKLDILSLAKGIVKPKIHNKNLIRTELKTKVSEGLSTRDLMYLGRHSSTVGYYEQAVDWYKTALEIATNEVNSSMLIREIDFALNTAINAHDYVLFRDGPRGATWRTRETPYSYKEFGNLEPKEFVRSKSFVPKLLQWQSEEEEYDHYERLCRGEELRDKSEEKNLKCYFKFSGSAYFTISPVKLEIQSQNPYIVVIHDMITDSQIDRFIELGKPKLLRSRHKGPENKNVRSQKRTSHSGWIKMHEDIKVLNKIVDRIELITELKVRLVTEAEDFQIANYGLGGLYVPHPDYLVHPPDTEGQNRSDWEKMIGDRIATLMVYLTDVDAGGATVFPRAGVSLWPQKGSAAFWWNLDTSGVGDDNTRHGACPVLYGDKWVSNKWIRMNEQFLLAPCDLEKFTLFQRPT